MQPISTYAEKVKPGNDWRTGQAVTQKTVEPVKLSSLNTIGRPSLAAAIESVRAWAAKKNDGYEGISLVISGPPGTGKTHIAKSILWAAHYTVEGSNAPVGYDGRFVMAADLIAGLDADGKPQDFINRDCRVFVIDDVGSEGNVQFVARDEQAEEIQRRYFRIIDYCYSWQVSVVITTNLSIKQMGGIVGRRCWSRLQEMAPAGCMIEIDAPDYRRIKGGR